MLRLRLSGPLASGSAETPSRSCPQTPADWSPPASLALTSPEDPVTPLLGSPPSPPGPKLSGHSGSSVPLPTSKTHPLRLTFIFGPDAPANSHPDPTSKAGPHILRAPHCLSPETHRNNSPSPHTALFPNFTMFCSHLYLRFSVSYLAHLLIWFPNKYIPDTSISPSFLFLFFCQYISLYLFFSAF